MDSELNKASNRHTDFTQSIEDDPLIDGPLIAPNDLEPIIKREFQKLQTNWGAVSLSVLHVAYVCVCLALAAVCWLTDTHSADCTAAFNGVDSKTVMLLLKAGLWLLVFLFERCVQCQHSAVRRRGYLRFYRKTAKLKHLPLLIHSAGNAAVLMVITPSSLLDNKVKNLSVYLLLIIICMEFVASVISLLVYAVHVLKFNKQSPSPDIIEDEKVYSSVTDSEPHTELGFRDGSCLEEVLENQADLIEHLKEHNKLLSKRILALMSQQSRD